MIRHRLAVEAHALLIAGVRQPSYGVGGYRTLRLGGLSSDKIGRLSWLLSLAQDNKQQRRHGSS